MSGRIQLIAPHRWLMPHRKRFPMPLIKSVTPLQPSNTKSKTTIFRRCGSAGTGCRRKRQGHRDTELPEFVNDAITRVTGDKKSGRRLQSRTAVGERRRKAAENRLRKSRRRNRSRPVGTWYHRCRRWRSLRRMAFVPAGRGSVDHSDSSATE